MVEITDIGLAEEFAKELENDLVERYGLLVGGGALFRVLGYSSFEAMRQAVSRKTAPIPIFSIPKRRGKFALSKDISLWLAKQRFENI